MTKIKAKTKYKYGIIFRSDVILSVVLLSAVVFSLIQLGVSAATPNPGHPWSQVGDGQWAATGTTAYHTYTFPDTTTTILTTNAAVTVAQGGTNLTSFAQGDLLYASAANVLSALTKNASSTTYLANTGTSNAPQWNYVDLSNGVTGALGVTNGGTGTTTFAAQDLVYATAANTIGALIKDTTATRYVSNTGGSNAPLWAQVNLANGVTGNLATTSLNSGTNATNTTFWRGDGTWASAGNLVSSQVFTSGAGATYTRPSGITYAIFELVGGGGGGGGAATGTSNAAVGGGGGGGGYTRKLCTILNGTETYTVGTGGIGGVTAGGGTGGSGVSSTITCGGSAKVQAGFGLGGVGQAAAATVATAAGGAAGSAQDGTFNVVGAPGTQSVRLSGTVGGSGAGGSSVLGGGGTGKTANGNGNTGGNYGGGGSGGVSLNGSAASSTGGVGGAGIIVVWEYQ